MTTETSVSTGRFQTKPAEVLARTWDGTTASADVLIDWIRANRGAAQFESGYPLARDCCVVVNGPRGPQAMRAGDWVVRDANGTWNVHSAESFERNYEPIPAD